MTEKSLVVQGKSLEEALNKAAVLLHCARESVAYELLQAAKPGRYGQPGTPCKLRVTPVAPALPDAARAETETRFPAPPDTLSALSSDAFLRLLDTACAELPPPAELDAPALPDGARREIVGDVNSVAGPVEFDGDLHIFGSVGKGASVTATGAIYVTGDVETARLDAGGSIVVDGGLLGAARSARGSVRCKFAQGARADAAVDVVVKESAMHSHLRAGRGVFVGDIVLGGSCYGEDSVEVRIAGSESGSPALLITGPYQTAKDALDALRETAQKLVEQRTPCAATRTELRAVEESDKPLPTDERVRLWYAALLMTQIDGRLTALAQRKKQLLGMMSADKAARVSVIDRAYPKVKIQINAQATELHALTQFATFSTDAETGEIRTTPYH